MTQLTVSIEDSALLDQIRQAISLLRGVVDVKLSQRTKADDYLKPLTMEEINAKIDQAERESAAGKFRSNKDVFKNLLTDDIHQVNERYELECSMGRIEPLLANRATTYRSILVNEINKIVYAVKGDTVEISGFWNMRREPQKLADSIK